MKIIRSRTDLKEEMRQAVKKPIPISCQQVHEAFYIKTKEGMMQGKKGDWVMIGVEGELYACDQDIFAKTYELIA